METTCLNQNYLNFIKVVVEDNLGNCFSLVKKMEVCRMTTLTKCGTIMTITTNVDKLQLLLEALVNRIKHGKL